MNVANLSLCKELYELSGWTTSDVYVDRFGTVASVRQPKSIEEIVCPAYDLGYLLRKLPEFSAICKRPTSTHGAKPYTAYVDDYQSWSDTPEDAAAKLAIELFKQGILAKELPNDHTQHT